MREFLCIDFFGIEALLYSDGGFGSWKREVEGCFELCVAVVK